MTLRRSIEAILLVAVLSAALPVRTLHAAEPAVPAASVPGRDTSAYAPKLIDPKSPPPSEAGGLPTPAPAAPGLRLDAGPARHAPVRRRGYAVGHLRAHAGRQVGGARRG
jgi:hypothetical protein